MPQTEENLGLSDEDLVDIDREVIEHALWFTAEGDLESDEESQTEIPIEKKEEILEENSESEPSPIHDKNILKKEEILDSTYYDLIQEEDENLHLILKAHFLEDLEHNVTVPQKDEFMDIIEDYHAYFDEDIQPEDIKMSKLIEAHYLLDDFLEEADDYDDNPVYFLKKTINYPMPPDILEKAQNMNDEEIIFLLAAFCIYDDEEEEAILRDPEDIKSKEIMSVIQKLAALEQID